MKNPTRQMLYRLLYNALIEMRVRGSEAGDKAVFTLADMFHNVPLQLNLLDKGEVSVQDIMESLQERAQRRNADGWLEQRMYEIGRYHPETLETDDDA